MRRKDLPAWHWCSIIFKFHPGQADTRCKDNRAYGVKLPCGLCRGLYFTPQTSKTVINCDQKSTVAACDEENYTDKIDMHEINYTNLMEGKHCDRGGCVNELLSVPSTHCWASSWWAVKVKWAGQEQQYAATLLPPNVKYFIKWTRAARLD